MDFLSTCSFSSWMACNVIDPRMEDSMEAHGPVDCRPQETSSHG